jgi:hypothetical protein
VFFGVLPFRPVLELLVEQAGMRSKLAADTRRSDSTHRLRRRRPETARASAINPSPGKANHKPLDPAPFAPGRNEPFIPLRLPRNEAGVGGGGVFPVVVMVRTEV